MKLDWITNCIDNGDRIDHIAINPKWQQFLRFVKLIRLFEEMHSCENSFQWSSSTDFKSRTKSKSMTS